MSLLIDTSFLWNETVWNPSMISTALWLDAADASTVTTVSGAVSQWNDKSGNARHVTQATAGNRPTLTSNGLSNRNVITFNAANSTRLSGSLTAASTTESSFVVVNASSANTNPQTLLGSSASQGRQFRLTSTTASLLAQASSLLGSSSTNAPKDVSSIVNLTYQTAGITTLSFFFNGTAAGTASSGNAVGGSGTTDIGAQGGGGEGLTGYIAEIVVLQSAPPTDTRQRIEGYLSHKWGLGANLPNDHPYKTVGPKP